MRIFWSAIAILLLAAAAVVMWPGKRETARAVTPPSAPEPQAPKQDSPPSAAPAPETVVPKTEPAPGAPPAPATANQHASADAKPAAPAADPLEELKQSATKPVDPERKPDSVAPPAAPSTPSATPASAEPFKFPDDPAFPADKITPSKAERKPDGSVLLDSRFVVRGEGTKESPYRITWDQLISAEEVYKPRLGQKRLPQRVTMLNNKYVRLSGFVAFPITSNNPKELLVMLNQWDGCCIGAPPTAYDAVEVRLAKPATGDQRLAYHGMLEGKFKVDPYEDGGWLIGLYLMEDATLKADN